MARQILSARTVAKLSGKDAEEVLLDLWDEGLDYINGLDSKILAEDQRKVCDRFSIPFGKEISKKKYWVNQLALTNEDFDKLLMEMGFKTSPRTKVVPKGSISKLKKELSKVSDIVSENKSALISSKKVQKIVSPPPKLVWEEVGHYPSCGSLRFLSCEEAESIHFLLAEDFKQNKDPIKPAGVKSQSLLESAIYRPQTGVGEHLKYPTIEMSAAALIHSMIHNHPFHNGNKRIALVSMLTFLDENGFIFEVGDKELFRQVLRIAKHQITTFRVHERDDREVLEIARWIKQKSRPIRKGELPVQFRKLKTILSSLGCSFEQRGNKTIVTRLSKKRGLFRGRKELRFVLHCSVDGQEVDQQTIKRLRSELELNEENSVDSEQFYNTQEEVIEEFIRRYRKTLCNLAKM